MSVFMCVWKAGSSTEKQSMSATTVLDGFLG